MVSAEINQVVEFFSSREAAQAFIAQVEGDEPGLAELLAVIPFELALSMN